MTSTAAAASATQDVIHAYRHLYRSLLQGVSYASPARYIARDQLRAAFREKDASLDAEGVRRTVWFFQAAARERGLEHHMLKNLIEVRKRRTLREQGSWKRILVQSKFKKPSPFAPHQKAAYDHYDMTVAMLNKTMGLCLR